MAKEKARSFDLAFARCEGYPWEGEGGEDADIPRGTVFSNELFDQFVSMVAMLLWVTLNATLSNATLRCVNATPYNVGIIKRG